MRNFRILEKDRIFFPGPVKIFILVLSFFLFALFAGCDSADPQSIIINPVDLSGIEDGVYKGSYNAFPVRVSVKVWVKSHRIENIKITKHFEGQGEKAEIIVSDVLKAQSVQVDTISGATLSSKCILKAIENALDSAERN